MHIAMNRDCVLFIIMSSVTRNIIGIPNHLVELNGLIIELNALSVSYYCVTNDPKRQWLKTIAIYLTHDSAC